MRIFDCTTFYSEHLMMDIRFHVLNDFVEKFIVCESTYSHSGKKKKLNFNINNYQKFKDKITYIVIDEEPPNIIGDKNGLAKPFEKPEAAFKIIHGDFVSTEDGTGIVHIAPTFGAEDAKVAAESGIPSMLVKNSAGELVPLVNLKGEFIDCLGDLSGKPVKDAYHKNVDKDRKSVDIEIAIALKEENKAFIEQHGAELIIKPVHKK